jgi:cobalt-zinc-cadmium efflux system protein
MPGAGLRGNHDRDETIRHHRPMAIRGVTSVSGPEHDHSHTAGAPRRVLAAVLALTSAVLLVEVVGAVWSGSLALLADAGHMLTDAGGLALALFAATLMQRPATDRLTWGYRRAEVLAAAVQAAVLLAVAGYVFYEAIRRLVDPHEVETTIVFVFGVVGLLANAAAIGLLTRARRTHGENLNTRAAMLEVLNDALGSVAVLLSAVVIALTGWLRADAVVSLLIAALIVPRTLRILRQAVDVLLEAAPRDVDMTEVRAHLLAVPHVRVVHDLHASTVGTGLPVLTAHLVVEDSCFHDGHLMTLLDDVQACLAGHFDLEHSTIQFESQAHLAHERHVHA